MQAYLLRARFWEIGYFTYVHIDVHEHTCDGKHAIPIAVLSDLKSDAPSRREGFLLMISGVIIWREPRVGPARIAPAWIGMVE